MESNEWPEPKKDTSGYLFLYPFYHQGSRRILQDSPQYSREMNMRRANKVASKALEVTARLSQVYGDEGFPVVDLEDPCELLLSLPVQMSVSHSYGMLNGATSLLLKPVLHRNMPSSARWLGHMDIKTDPGGDNPHVASVCVNQPGENRGLQLGQHPDFPNYGNSRSTIDSYPGNTQAMNFVGIVSEYLDKLDSKRLVVVQGVNPANC